MKTTSISALALCAALLGGLSSCRKEDKDTDTSVAKNESTVDRYFTEINDISDEAARSGNLSSFKLAADEATTLSSCATVTLDTSSAVSAANPDTIIIDFGSGCTSNDGKTRSGRIIISSTGRYFETGTVVTTTPDNYVVNGNQISGTRVVTNTGNNSSGQPTFSVSVNGTVVLADNGGTITWSATRTRTWTAGYNTPFLFADDEITLSGSSNGSNSNGGSWTTSITVPLVYKRYCHQFVSGVRMVTPENKPQRTFDYGNGDCDNSATVTINGNTYTITLN